MKYGGSHEIWQYIAIMLGLGIDTYVAIRQIIRRDFADVIASRIIKPNCTILTKFKTIKYTYSTAAACKAMLHNSVS